MIEVWKYIEGYEDYMVSSLGRVKSYKRKKPQVLRMHTVNSGYLTLILRANNKSKRLLVSRLVAAAFLPNPERKREVNHIDSNRLNNNLDNLEWSTSSENKLHSFRDGDRRPHYKMRGENHGKAKLTDFKVKRMRLIKEITPSITYKKLSSLFGIDRGTCRDAITRRRWKHVI